MPIPGTVQVTGTLAPTDVSDQYAVTDAIYGIDGLRSVQTLLDRDAISSQRRREGMLVYVRDEGKYYKLNSDLLTWQDFGANLGTGFQVVTSTIPTISSYDIILGPSSSYKYGKFLFHGSTISKWYTSEILVSKNQDDLITGYSQSEYAVLGNANLNIELVIVGPDIILRVNNNEPISMDIELVKIYSV